MSFDGIIGYSPVALAQNAIGLNIAIKDPAKVRDAWQSAYGRSGNSNKVAVLEDGLTYRPISMSNSDAQFFRTRKFQIEEICRIFQVPPHEECVALMSRLKE